MDMPFPLFPEVVGFISGVFDAVSQKRLLDTLTVSNVRHAAGATGFTEVL
jgi:hypothetical protein